jgi:cell division protein FtsN
MKKYTVLCAGLCAAMVFTGCKSSESAYKQAYLKAKQQEELQQQQSQQEVQEQAAVVQEQAAVVQQPADENTVVTPLQERDANNTQVVDNGDKVLVRQENVAVVNGGGLKNFSVVVGSFSLKTNAEGLQQTLKNEGYDAQVVVNNNVQPAAYRVIATTFDAKADAVASRNQLITRFPGAWLLYAK